MIAVGIAAMACSGMLSLALAGPSGRSEVDVPELPVPTTSVVIAREVEAVARGWRLVRKRQGKMSLPVGGAAVIACTSRAPESPPGCTVVRPKISVPPI